MVENVKKIEFPPKFRPAQEIVQKLENAGYAAYFVGGCVRDALLGEEIGEIDITTDANAEVVTQVFPDAKPIFPYHYSCFRMKREGLVIEIARMRRDVVDFGRQSIVDFVSDIHVDLARRDLTINAICADGYGTLIDDFGGIADLRCGKIAVIGQPKMRFEQDCLRMLRVLRFAAKLDFTVDSGVSDALFECQTLWTRISPASAWREFAKLNKNFGKFRDLLVFHKWFAANFQVDAPNFLFTSDLLNSNLHFDDNSLLYNMFFYLTGVKAQLDVRSRVEFPKAFRKKFVENAELIGKILEYSLLSSVQKSKILQNPNSHLLAEVLCVRF